MTLIEALRLLTTQTEPSGAMASVRGAVPTAISASLARVTVSNDGDLSLSGLTTHSRALAPLRWLERQVGRHRRRVARSSGRWTLCMIVWRCSMPALSVAVDGDVVHARAGEGMAGIGAVGDHAVAGVPSPKSQR